MLKNDRDRIPRLGRPGRSCLPPMRTAEGREAAAALDRLAAAVDAILDKCGGENEMKALAEDATSVAIVAPLTLALLCLKLQSSIAEPTPEVKAMCDELETALDPGSQVPTHHAVRMICQLSAMQSRTVAQTLDLLCKDAADTRPH